MEKISTCLWLDNNAEEAVDFYTSLFANTRVGDTTYHGESGAKMGHRVGSVMAISFVLEGLEFMALNGGPMFRPNPSISFTVSCETAAEIEKLFERFSDGGTVMMPLAAYPFSEKFGWVADKFGISWQLNLKKRDQKIAPSMMFVGEQFGKAEEAVNFYVSTFKNSKVTSLTHYGPGEPGKEGTVKHAIFSLNGTEFMAIDADGPHPFTFTPALSFMIHCANQEEIDEKWNALSADGEGQCGWVTDKFGVSWQIVPSVLNGMLVANNGEKAEQVMEAVMKMKKLNIEELNRAYNGPVHAK
jgi:predicted 3-demethylubiquinone-9 3-methyltransferase (glyoxalase superfamily)